MGLWNSLIWLLGLVCFVWVVYDVWGVQKKMKTGMKVLWTVLALFFNIITAIVYYFIVKNK